MTQAEALERAIQIAGTQAALAEMASRDDRRYLQGHVGYWKRAGKVSASAVLDVERATGVSRHDLRPDLYPREEAAA